MNENSRRTATPPSTRQGAGFGPAAIRRDRDATATALAAEWRRQKFPTPRQYIGDTSHFDQPELSESDWAADIVVLGDAHGMDLENDLAMNRANLAAMRAEGMTASDVVHWLDENKCPQCVAEGRA
jgi:hypothetical protein